MEIFGVMELVLPLGGGAPANPEARMVIENQSLVGHLAGDGKVRFRFCARDPKLYRYTIRSNAPALDGRGGELTTFLPSMDAALSPDPSLPHWWTDDPSPAVAEGSHHGAKTVSQWREPFLRDFAARLERCRAADSDGNSNPPHP
jgi:hypothetical protein